MMSRSRAREVQPGGRSNDALSLPAPFRRGIVLSALIACAVTGVAHARCGRWGVETPTDSGYRHPMLTIEDDCGGGGGDLEVDFERDRPAFCAEAAARCYRRCPVVPVGNLSASEREVHAKARDSCLQRCEEVEARCRG